MPTIKRKESDSFDMTLRRFKRACEKAGIHSKLRKLEFYEKPTWERRRRKAAQVKRYHKKRMKDNESRDRNRARTFRYRDRITAPEPPQDNAETEAA